MTKPVCSCSRPIKDHAYLCTECTEQLARNLGSLPALADDLDTTRTRQSRMGGPGIGIVVRDAERPLPWNDKAARMAHELRAMVVAWVRLCEDWRVAPEGAACRACWHPSCSTIRATRAPEDTIAAMSRYLLAALPSLRHRPEVTEAADTIDSAMRSVERIIDRAADRTYFGPCGSVDYIGDEPDPSSVPCPTDLYGPENATDLVCPSCRAEHNVSDVRAYLLQRAEDRLVTASDLSRFLTVYGEPLTAERIRQWAARGQLVAHGKDAAGRPLYRVSEAVDLLASLATRRKNAG